MDCESLDLAFCGGELDSFGSCSSIDQFLLRPTVDVLIDANASRLTLER